MVVSLYECVGLRRRERIFTQVDISRSLSLSCFHIFTGQKQSQDVPVNISSFLNLVLDIFELAPGRTCPPCQVPFYANRKRHVGNKINSEESSCGKQEQ